ncbi:MAG: DNA mismatch repair endonuclease MutL, partial [Psychrobacter sp.]|nr:DNA mismatch repair endonuclease MutL [Psychrobacter sp.]
MPDNDSNTRIKKLSPLLINQLAAGEVVTRPAAVVKELLENAIDANATNIEIHITQGGMSMIEVIDNGVGIHADDMVMAITRHATSKVADVANLHGITTLGFRGEALAATAAVSRLTLTSSHDNSGVGRQLQVAGVLDDVPKLIPVVHQRGTTITVKDLYFNVPARRGNLKSIATEFGHIETIVREVALARADVALTLFHDNKKRLSLSSRSVSSSASGNGNDTANRLPLSRLEQATGIPLKDNALKIAIDLSSLMHQSSKYTNHSVNKQAGVDGWLWPITGSQPTVPKLIYVNGRLVKEALISNQLRQLAQAAQLAGIGYALYFELPTEWLNINVHPSKQRIKITSLNNIMAHLNHAIQSKLKNIAAIEQAAINDKQSNQIIEENTLTSNEVLDAADNRVVKKNYKNTAIPYQNIQENRQVKAPKQSYQLAASATDAAIRNTVNSSDQISIRYDALPHCLDIITDL